MGHVANFMGRVFARFRRDDGVRDGEVDPREAHSDVERIRHEAFKEGIEFAEIVRQANKDDDMSVDEVLAQAEHELNEVVYPGYVRNDDDPVVH